MESRLIAWIVITLTAEAVLAAPAAAHDRFVRRDGRVRCSGSTTKLCAA